MIQKRAVYEQFVLSAIDLAIMVYYIYTFLSSFLFLSTGTIYCSPCQLNSNSNPTLHTAGTRGASFYGNNRYYTLSRAKQVLLMPKQAPNEVGVLLESEVTTSGSQMPAVLKERTSGNDDPRGVGDGLEKMNWALDP